MRALAQRFEQPGTSQSEALIELKSGGPRNLFLVHDGEGETLLYLNLARRMPGDLAVSAFSLVVLPGCRLHTQPSRIWPHSTCEELRKKQAHGPYLLRGECAGGVIAYEMAAQLERAGERIELVALFDAAVPYAIKRRGRIAKERFGRLKQTLEQARDSGHGRFRKSSLSLAQSCKRRQTHWFGKSRNAANVGGYKLVFCYCAKPLRAK